MKKMIYGFLLWFVALFGVMSVSPVALADTGWWAAPVGYKDTTEVKSNPMLAWSWNGVAWAGTSSDDGLLNVIKNFINWTLWMLATIALVICLYAGFKMVTSAGDEGKYKEGIEMMKKAGIGLVIIGLAWMIVSVVMWLLNALTA